MGSSDERWFIDPLDGTTNYAHGYPIFCVSIACERAGELIAAVVYAPVSGELYAAERGSGARLGDTPLRVSSIDEVAEALVCTGFMPSAYEVNGRYFAAISQLAQAVRRDGSAALDLAAVAAGRFDAFWEWGLHAWDIAAGMLLIREAGGRVSAIDGGSVDLFDGSILATNGRTHDEMQSRLIAAR